MTPVQFAIVRAAKQMQDAGLLEYARTFPEDMTEPSCASTADRPIESEVLVDDFIYSRRPGSVEAHIRTVMGMTGRSRRSILGPSHESRCAFARRTVAVLLRRDGHSLTTIGKWLNRHHTSVVYMLERSRVAGTVNSGPENSHPSEWESALNRHQLEKAEAERLSGTVNSGSPTVPETGSDPE